jgi:hypothetical protein
MSTLCASCPAAGTCNLQLSWGMMEAFGLRARASQAYQIQRWAALPLHCLRAPAQQTCSSDEV